MVQRIGYNKQNIQSRKYADNRQDKPVFIRSYLRKVKDKPEKALASGMDAHLAKPIDINAVMRTLAEILD
jgi:hypothetical protein